MQNQLSYTLVGFHVLRSYALKDSLKRLGLSRRVSLHNFQGFARKVYSWIHQDREGNTRFEKPTEAFLLDCSSLNPQKSNSQISII